MRFYALIVGLLSGWLIGKVVDYFLDYDTYNGVAGGLFTGILVFIFFRDSKLPNNYFGINDKIDTNPIWHSSQTKALLENSYLFWIGNFIVAIVLSALGKIGWWGAFITGALSLVISITSIGLGVGILKIFMKKRNIDADSDVDEIITNIIAQPLQAASKLNDESDKLITELCGFDPACIFPNRKKEDLKIINNAIIYDLIKNEYDNNYTPPDIALIKLCYYATNFSEEEGNCDLIKIKNAVNQIYFKFGDSIRPELKLSDSLHQLLDYGYTEHNDEDEDDGSTTRDISTKTKIKVIGMLAGLVENCLKNTSYDEFANGYICLGRGFYVGHLQNKPTNDNDNLCCIPVADVIKDCEAMEVARYIKDTFLLSHIVNDFCLKLSKQFEAESIEYRELKDV